MQNTFLQLIETRCIQQPDTIAINAGEQRLSYKQLWQEIALMRGYLKSSDVTSMAVALPNCAAWVILDLAAALEGVLFVPVPHFFTPSQLQHLLKDAQVDLYISAVLPATQLEHSGDSQIDCLGLSLHLKQLHPEPTKNIYPSAFKISYTSGTTGAPKGVLITVKQVSQTVNSILESIPTVSAQRHLSVLPYSLLLENIIGIYAVLASGGSCYVPDFSELGLSGSSQVDWRRFSSVIRATKPSSMIVVPALLQGLMHCMTRLDLDASSLDFIAVGGAPVSRTLLAQAEQIGLPLFQGYGMTECGSVVCLNTPDNNRSGSVGKPLPHVSVRIDEQGQIMIGGVDFIGYTGAPSKHPADEWPSGDLGRVDDDGYVYVTARRHSAYSTAFGRNVSPEWVESELESTGVVAQSSVFGEGRTHNVAVIVAAQEGIPDAQIQAGITAANACLPDYAQIAEWVRAEQPFSTQNQQRSPAGTLRRAEIYQHYQHKIEPLFNGNRT